ncbi:thioesterase [Janthinobacterium lividum]|nr:thioesterase [Janthinobacterium lividum]
MNLKNWLIRRDNIKRPMRLYCFSYAGGSAANYLGWQQAMEPDIEICAVQLPGRGTRMGEKPIGSLSLVVERIAESVALSNHENFAFFGHSLGALIAFEVAQYNQRNRLEMPLHLFASGCAAPQARRPPRGLHMLPDRDFIEELRKYNGTPNEILENQELMSFLLPMLRADFGLADEYVHRHAQRLSVPISVLAGLDDDLSSPGVVSDWQKETSAAFDVQWFDGGHFFVNDSQALIHRFLKTKLEELVM